jgi:DNA polymerase elongation subunit (family B)
MTNKNDKFKRGQIFQVVSETTCEIFISSTIQPLHVRLASYNRDYRNYLKRLDQGQTVKFKTIFKILEQGDAKIYLIKKYEAETIEDLRREERQEIEERITSLNKQKDLKITNGPNTVKYIGIIPQRHPPPSGHIYIK